MADLRGRLTWTDPETGERVETECTATWSGSAWTPPADVEAELKSVTMRIEAINTIVRIDAPSTVIAELCRRIGARTASELPLGAIDLRTDNYLPHRTVRLVWSDGTETLERLR